MSSTAFDENMSNGGEQGLPKAEGLLQGRE